MTTLDPCDCHRLRLTCAPRRRELALPLTGLRPTARGALHLPPYERPLWLQRDVMVAFVASPLLGGQPCLPSRVPCCVLHARRPSDAPFPRSRLRMALPSDSSCPLPPPAADPVRRRVLNLLLAGAAAPVVFGVLGPYGASLSPPRGRRAAGGGERVVATDIDGAPVTVATLVAAAPADGHKTMVVGLQGEPAWITAAPPDHVDHFALSAVCTHMGCVVPWVPSRGKFVCPCHASEYDRQGRVLRGPAPLPLALEHAAVEEEGGPVILSSWTESDFRTGMAPWWSF